MSGLDPTRSSSSLEPVDMPPASSTPMERTPKKCTKKKKRKSKERTPKEEQHKPNSSDSTTCEGTPTLASEWNHISGRCSANFSLSDTALDVEYWSACRLSRSSTPTPVSSRRNSVVNHKATQARSSTPTPVSSRRDSVLNYIATQARSSTPTPASSRRESVFNSKATRTKHSRTKDPRAGIYIRFQFRGPASEPGRIFQANQLHILYRRAREYYNIDGDLGLWCSPPGIKSVRYIFVGEEGLNEFRILQNLMYNVGVVNENALVEVRLHEPVYW
ncbi:uncharacterized protein N7515_007985 [Penicillium bovifimosum]|uniref:Uncharacterized protein n=1 Tax=Penicillium bovifimosum TaxID=126998 RepID=A0A9W9GM24_9EURO|nr:uncharacterized protein N7515_007985 [Penicillium bovifimosum]KAJ5124160.1 hypothetical protein N7515_007985 [Penicillium bovifimosum]